MMAVRGATCEWESSPSTTEVMSLIRELTELAGRMTPVLRPEKRDWIRFESSIGMKFSPDYKNLLSTIGLGEFGRVLILRSPNAPGHFRLAIETLTQYKE